MFDIAITTARFSVWLTVRVARFALVIIGNLILSVVLSALTGWIVATYVNPRILTSKEA